MAEWGSWCQISLELVLGVAFKKLALEWCCWHPQAGLLFSLAALCLTGSDMHREVGDRSLHQPTKPAEGLCLWDGAPETRLFLACNFHLLYVQHLRRS